MAAKRGRKPRGDKPGPGMAGEAARIAGKVGPEAAISEPPAHLEGLEVDAWRSCCAALASRGTLESADMAIVEQFAVTYAMSRRIREQLKGEPLTTKCPGSGRAFVNPLIALQSDHAYKLRGLLIELGLTPRSRRAPQGAGDEADPMTAFLAEGTRR